MVPFCDPYGKTTRDWLFLVNIDIIYRQEQLEIMLSMLLWNFQFEMQHDRA